MQRNSFPYPAILRRGLAAIGQAVLMGALTSTSLSSLQADELRTDRIAGPVEARVVKVRDGDTVEVDAFIWPRQSVRVAVRLRGIDAPEHRGKCPAEKQAAGEATARLKELVGDRTVRLTSISGGKYYGRVLADLSTSASGDLGEIMLREGLVDRYEGGNRRDWCAKILSGEVAGPHPWGSFTAGHRG